MLPQAAAAVSSLTTVVPLPSSLPAVVCSRKLCTILSTHDTPFHITIAHILGSCCHKGTSSAFKHPCQAAFLIAANPLCLSICFPKPQTRSKSGTTPAMLKENNRSERIYDPILLANSWRRRRRISTRLRITNTILFVNGKVGRQSPIAEILAGRSPSCPLPGIPTFGPFLVGFLRFRI
ncbi:unnamed protein product [Sphagnum jensenii]